MRSLAFLVGMPIGAALLVLCLLTRVEKPQPPTTEDGSVASSTTRPVLAPDHPEVEPGTEMSAGAAATRTRLRIRVIDESGGAIPAAVVGTWEDRKEPQRASTGQDGWTSIENVGPGKVTATARSPGREGGSATAIVRAGQITQAEIRLAKSKPLHGRVTATVDDRPVSSATVRICRGLDWIGISPGPASCRLGEMESSAKTDADGRFVTNAPTGLNVICVEADGYATARRLFSRAPGVRSTEISVALAPSARVVGRVVDSDGRPVRAEIRVKPAALWLSVSEPGEGLDGTDDIREITFNGEKYGPLLVRDSWMLEAHATDEAGRFAIDGLTAGMSHTRWAHTEQLDSEGVDVVALSATQGGDVELRLSSAAPQRRPSRGNWPADLLSPWEVNSPPSRERGAAPSNCVEPGAKPERPASLEVLVLDYANLPVPQAKVVVVCLDRGHEYGDYSTTGPDGRARYEGADQTVRVEVRFGRPENMWSEVVDLIGGETVRRTTRIRR